AAARERKPLGLFTMPAPRRNRFLTTGSPLTSGAGTAAPPLPGLGPPGPPLPPLAARRPGAPAPGAGGGNLLPSLYASPGRTPVPASLRKCAPGRVRPALAGATRR